MNEEILGFIFVHQQKKVFSVCKSIDDSKWQENRERKVNRKSKKEIHHEDANVLVCQHRIYFIHSNYGYEHRVQCETLCCDADTTEKYP